jgi:DNA-binding IclR family transcriptional regulator
MLDHRTTDRQRSILNYIKRYMLENAEAPSVYLIARRHGLGRSTVREHLLALARKGYLRVSSDGMVTPGSVRCLHLLD